MSDKPESDVKSPFDRLSGLRVIANSVIPDDVIYVSPKTFEEMKKAFPDVKNDPLEETK